MSVTAPELDRLIDDFNRANGPIAAGAGAAIWTPQDVYGTWGTNMVVSNNAMGAGTAWDSAYTIPKIKGDNFDILIDCVTPGSTMTIIAPIVNVGSAQATGWRLQYTGTTLDLTYGLGDNWQNWTWVQNGPCVLQAGHTVWWAKRGNVHTLRRRTSAGGAFDVVFTVTSALHNPPEGVIGIQMETTAQRWDNLRAGPVVGDEPPPTGAYMLRAWSGQGWTNLAGELV